MQVGFGFVDFYGLDRADAPRGGEMFWVWEFFPDMRQQGVKSS